MLGLRSAIENASTPEELTAAIAAAGSSPRWMASTLAEVAAFFGLSVQTVKQWRTESPPMPGSDDGWPLNQIVAWRHAKLAMSPTTEAKRKQDLELGEIQIEQKRLDLSIQKKELLDRSDVELWAATALIKTRQIVMSLPEKIATSAPPELREAARTEADLTCRAALSALRRDLEMDQIDVDETYGEADCDESSNEKGPTNDH